MINNNGSVGFVVAIEKVPAVNASVTFLQFLLRNEKKCYKDALYYIFRKEQEILGYVEIRYFQNEFIDKPFSFFVNPLYLDLYIEKQMINFVIGDFPLANFTADVENTDMLTIKILEEFDFRLQNTIKQYKLSFQKFNYIGDNLTTFPLSKINKDLKQQFEDKLLEKIRKISQELNNELIIDQKNSFYQKFMKDISPQNSFLLIEGGIIIGWLLFKKGDDNNLYLLDYARGCEEDKFYEFVKASVKKLIEDKNNIRMEVINDDKVSKMIVSLFDEKPQKIIYKYLRIVSKAK